MAEVLLQFDRPIAFEDGSTFTARVCGRDDGTGRWEGWIEFEAPAQGGPIRTARETVQPNRRDLEYWATGLTVPYLEGALQRARDAERPPQPRPAGSGGAALPAFDGPAPTHDVPASFPGPVGERPILDPVSVFAQGEEVLRKELSALDEAHLRRIASWMGLPAPREAAGVEPLLIDAIVTAARLRSLREG